MNESGEGCVLTVPAASTWAEAERSARAAGLTFGYLVDTVPSRTVGCTLERPSWLPPLWPPHTARAACIALKATTPDGSYRTVVAPRTASGPDLRALFLEARGRFGVIDSVSLGCEPFGDVAWLRHTRGGGLDAARTVASVCGSVTTLHGDADGLAVRVRLGSRLAEVAVSRLRSAGFADAAAPSRDDLPRTLACLAWNDAVDPLGTVGLVPLAAGPTHVALASAQGDDDAVVRAVERAVGPARLVRDTDQAPADGPVELGEVAL